MDNQQLTDYIKQQKEAGENEEEIKNNLLRAGWQEEDVNKALGIFDQASPPPPPSTPFSSTGLKYLDPKVIWAFFIRFMVPFLVVLIFPLFMLMLPLIDPTAVHAFSIGALVIFLVSILLLGLFFSYIWAKLSYKYYRYELIEEDFRKECGVVFKKYTTIPYERIQNINIQRGIIDRILGLSSLKIFTAGTGVSGAAGAEGLLPGLSESVAEELRNELTRRSRHLKNQ